jgi:peptidoglycan hydrolase-like protein with peptidoglycan-binding domain
MRWDRGSEQARGGKEQARGGTGQARGGTTRPAARLRVALAGAIVAVLLSSAFMASGVSAASIPSGFPHQSLGNRGVDVKAIQGFLRHHGAMTARVDGVFGTSTETAVRTFQQAQGLTVDGRVGQHTWARLLVRVEPGTTGEAVKALQRQLNEKRAAGVPVDGVFGTSTRAALRSFQRHVGVADTGIAGPVTWKALIRHLERPVFGAKLCDYQVGNGLADWGTAAAQGQLEAAAYRVVDLGHGRLAVGDISREHGGDIAGHQSHEVGLDVDLRPMRVGRDQCTWGVDYHWSTYDRAATRDLVKAIRATAPGHVKLIYFNDPVLIREGLVTWYSGHDDHLHVRYCERIHALSAYDC